MGCGAVTAILPRRRQTRGGDGRRYAYAKQFKRHSRELRTCLGRLIRDISRKIASNANIEVALPCRLRAPQIRSQQQRQRGWKLYSFHVPGDRVQRALRVRR
jgi:hypothetical protein